MKTVLILWTSRSEISKFLRSTAVLEKQRTDNWISNEEDDVDGDDEEDDGADDGNDDEDEEDEGFLMKARNDILI